MRTFLSVISFLSILFGALLSISFLSVLAILPQLLTKEIPSSEMWSMGAFGIGGVALLIVGYVVNSYKKRKYPKTDTVSRNTEDQMYDATDIKNPESNKAVSFFGIPLFLIIAIIFISYTHSIFYEGKIYNIDSRFISYYIGHFLLNAFVFTIGLYAILRAVVRKAHLYPFTMLFFVMAIQTAVFRFAIEKHEAHIHFDILNVSLVVLVIGLTLKLARKIFDS